MFTRKLLVTLILVLGVVGAVSYSWVQKSQTAPLSPGDAKRTRCEVHGALLQTDVVPIMYGDVGFPDGYFQARSQFPNASSSALGGCVVSRDSPRQQTVKFCSQCRKAQEQWGQQHRSIDH